MTSPDVATRCARGLVRRENQDHVFADAAKGVFCVCDGMGGGQGGAEASRIACDAVAKAVEPEDAFADRILRIERGVNLAHEEIRRVTKSAGYWAMGTTFAALLVDRSAEGAAPQIGGVSAPKAAVGWAGDSRVYRFRSGVFERLTHDHTVACELDRLAGGGGDPDNRKRAYSHMLTRAVGVDDRVKLDWLRFVLEPGDCYLVCSDGVHDMLKGEVLTAIFAPGGTAEEIAKRLEAAILAAGAGDNYSFAIARF